MNVLQKTWVEKGYSIFAHEGPNGLKVERLAKLVGKNKSSFYHHFADLTIFKTYLLDYHIDQSYILAEKESKCQSMDELIVIILDHKIDLLFNRQLRIHRDISDYEKCLEKVSQITVPGFIGIWAEIMGLKENSYLADLVLQLSLENFFLQINEKTLNEIWLKNYFNKLKSLVHALKKSSSSPIKR